MTKPQLIPIQSPPEDQIPLTEYVTIKDRYCLIYAGDDSATLDRLKDRSAILAKYPKLHLSVAVKDHHELYGDDKGVITLTMLGGIRKTFSGIAAYDEKQIEKLYGGE